MRPEEFQAWFSVSRETLDRLQVYHDLLIKWQKAINLVSPQTLREVWHRHFADSAQLSTYIEQGAVLADIGSGAGFPPMVLAIMRPDLTVHMIESDERKCEFLRTVSRETEVPVHIHTGRAEKVLPDLHSTLFTARAFASLLEILELFCRAGKGGASLEALLLKGRQWEEEVATAQKSYRFAHESFASLTDSDAVILRVRGAEKL